MSKKDNNNLEPCRQNCWWTLFPVFAGILLKRLSCPLAQNVFVNFLVKYNIYLEKRLRSKHSMNFHNLSQHPRSLPCIPLCLNIDYLAFCGELFSDVNIPYVLFCFWLLSFNITLVRSTHAAARGGTCSFQSLQPSAVRIYLPCLIRSAADWSRLCFSRGLGAGSH